MTLHEQLARDRMLGLRREAQLTQRAHRLVAARRARQRAERAARLARLAALAVR